MRYAVTALGGGAAAGVGSAVLPGLPQAVGDVVYVGILLTGGLALVALVLLGTTFLPARRSSG